MSGARPPPRRVGNRRRLRYTSRMPHHRPWACWPLILLSLGPICPAVGSEIDFARDIRPILSENCVFCHGPDRDQREADLRLDTAEGAAPMIEPGDAELSELFRRIISDDEDERMPPPDSNRELTVDQIERIREWIDQGAPWDQHWSFRPITRPPLEGDRHPIDALVTRQLAERGMKLSPPAGKRTLLRRLTLDVTGLAPTPEQLAAFLSDDSPAAYERVVDRLLASPAYGQRMAWEWLDAARYADTNGYQGDAERTMWPWRDWVVQAFNRNMPYDQFTIWQLAGDLMPAATEDQVLATAFLRNQMINGEGGRIPEENRVEYVMEMTETVGTVWLGLTLNCCRCHDHKYDPISIEEYYQLFAIFNQTPVDGSGGNPRTPPVQAVPTPAQADSRSQLQAQLDAAVAAVASLVSDTPEYTAATQQRDQLARQLEQLEQQIPQVMVMGDRDQPRPTYVLTRGAYNQPADEVSAGLPDCLPTESVSETQLDRLALARWLVADENPLTARVTVNRIWQQFFGVGLVKTTEDFGAQGELPVYPELLDFLADWFRQSGWDVKGLVRLIVTSETYQQSSRIPNPEVFEADPDNRWLARGSRYRLPAWMLRDQALAASGLLSATANGPSINTYQPPGIWEEASFGKKQYQRDAGEKLYRRSLYVFWRRIIAPPMFFDSANRQVCEVKIHRTNTPLHALQLLNNVTYIEAARTLAETVLQSEIAAEEVDQRRIDEVMLRLLARPASPQEFEILLAGLQQTRTQFAADPAAAIALISLGDSARDETLDPVEHAAWTSLCLAVLNLDETLNRE